MKPPKVDRKLPRCLHLRRSREFGLNRRTGVRARTPHFVVCASPGPSERARIGLVVGRKVGSAVLRNGVKRRLREIFRQNRERVPASADIVMVALPGAAVLGYEEMQREILGCISRLVKTAPERKEPRPG